MAGKNNAIHSACVKCGVSGHNHAQCQQNAKQPTQKATAKTKNAPTKTQKAPTTITKKAIHQTCLKCGVFGHNRAQCPQNAKQPTKSASGTAATQENRETNMMRAQSNTQMPPDHPTSTPGAQESFVREEEASSASDSEDSSSVEDAQDLGQGGGDSESIASELGEASNSHENDQNGEPDDEISQHIRLCLGPGNEAGGSAQMARSQESHTLKTTPVFSSKVRCHTAAPREEDDHPLFNKYGLLGLRRQTYDRSGSTDSGRPADNLIYSNTSAPWSVFICGQQGAGKSYTLSCLLENALTSNPRLGKNDKPLTGLVFHYDNDASDQICEAAYLCSAGLPVQVLVMPSNYRAMRKAYELAGIPDHHQPVVKPLLLDDRFLQVDHMLTLMGARSNPKPPLYISSLVQVVRTMKTNDEAFTIAAFERKVDTLKLSPDQKQPLALRMELLKSLMYSTASPVMRKRAGNRATTFDSAGLTIVDLSCSTMHESDVCSLYQICLSTFSASRNPDKHNPQSVIVAVDEAHKFLNDSAEAMDFTEALMRLVRQQRHLSARVIVATQEPTLSTNFLDFCDVSIVHRFRSPAWFEVIKNHLAGMVWTGGSETNSSKSVFETIVGLGDGEALLFCPNAYLDTPEPAVQDLLQDLLNDNDTVPDHAESLQLPEGGMLLSQTEPEEQNNTIPRSPTTSGKLKPLNTAYIKLQIRKRVTADGGESLMAA